MDSIGTVFAKTHFTEILERVVKGEKITITKHGVPFAVMQPVSPKPPVEDVIAELKRFRSENRLDNLATRTLTKIISGGQTGADRAALDAALEKGFPCGGYCPKGRMAEDGPIDRRYPLIEIKGGYSQRTRKNVVESDGTVIFYERCLSGGTEQTLVFCIRTGKPYKLIDIESMDPDQAFQKILEFITRHGLGVVNIAGPRASNCPEMYDFVKKAIGRIVRRCDFESIPD